MTQRNEPDTARLFWSGRSQAVRLPKDYRFRGDRVRIRRQGSSVVLEPIAEEWKWLDDITERFDEDFIKAVQEQPKPQERPAIEKLFR